VIRFAVLAALFTGAIVAAAAACPVTNPESGSVKEHGNEFLKVYLPPGSRYVFRPGGAGFVDRDGALGIKFAWIRLVPGKLEVGGRRLDGDAPPARAYLYDYGNEGGQPTYLVFPMPGCWEITGGVGEGRLSFVVVVEKIGAGPDWQFEGLGKGWRVASLPEKST